jgi:predicted DNA-binding transcriptional regulator YafY
MPDSNINVNLAHIVFRLLTDPRGWREDAIRSDLEIADRTYRKYRKILQDFPPFVGEDGESLIIEVQDGDARYLRLKDRSFSQRERRQVTSQFAALNFSQQLMSLLGDTHLGNATDAFIKTFRAQLRKSPYDLQEMIRNVDRMFFQLPDAPKDYTAKSSILEELVECIVFRVPIQIDYSSAAFKNLQLEIKPYTLAMYRSALYLIARGSDEEIRIYAVDRISNVTRIKAKAFEYPSPGTYDPKQYTEGSFGIYRSDSKDLTKFELIFANERWLKLYVSERRWHPTQKFTEMKDGRLRMTFEVNTEVEVWPWIRQFGDQVEVVKPKRTGPASSAATRIETAEAPLASLATAAIPASTAPRVRSSGRRVAVLSDVAIARAADAEKKKAQKEAREAARAAKAAEKAAKAKRATKAKPAAKTETKPAAKATKTAAKAETKPAAKATKTAAKAETKPAAKAETKPAAKATKTAKAETKPAAKDTKPKASAAKTTKTSAGTTKGTSKRK